VYELLEQKVKVSERKVNGERKFEEKALEVVPENSTKKVSQRMKQKTSLIEIFKIIIILKFLIMITMKREVKAMKKRSHQQKW